MGAMTTIAALTAGASLLSARQQAAGLEASAAYSERMAGVNERLSNMQAEDAEKRGEVEAGNVLKRANQIKGSQRAGFAAQGIAVDSGSAQDVQTETAEMGALDALTVRNNAQREAWGYRVQGAQGRASAEMDAMGKRNTAGATLLTGGIQAADTIARSYASGGFRAGGNHSSDNAYAINRRSDR